jgi:hypothetical protein
VSAAAKRAPRVPFYGPSAYERCYACDACVAGYRDRRPEGGRLELACARHADPAIVTFNACSYCDGPVRKGSIVIDGVFAHAACERAGCRS